MVPDSLGEAVDYYYCVNIGAWTDGTAIEFEVAVDELSLIGPLSKPPFRMILSSLNNLCSNRIIQIHSIQTQL